MRNFICSICLCVLFLGCDGESSRDKYEAVPGTPAVSPSGQYILETYISTEQDGDYYKFRILDSSSKEVVFRSKMEFAARHMTWFLWDNENRAWVYSGDIGTYYWELQPNKGWRKNTYYSYRKNSAPAPLLLKERRPQFFEDEL